jgi:hypothetical protein
MIRRFLPLLAAAFLAAAPAAAQTAAGQYVPVPTWASGYPNIGDIKVELARYHDSGRYAADQRAVGAQAEQWLRARAAQGRAKGEKLAAVFDIDETSLSNYPALKVNDYGRVFPGPCVNVTTGPCGIVAWTASGQDAVIPSSLQLFRLRGLGATDPGAEGGQVQIGSRLQGAEPQGDRKGRLHDRAEHRRSAERSPRRLQREDVPHAKPVLPHPLT